VTGDAARGLRLLGLGVRARSVIVGVEQVRAGVLAERVLLVVVAGDASHHGRDKIVPLVERRGITMIETASADALGAAVGRPATTVVGVVDATLARGVADAFGVRENRV